MRSPNSWIGNRSQVQTTPPTPPTAVTYATDVVNQYTTIGGVTRGHDNNGNLKDDGTQLYGYDFENRLVEVKLKSTSAVVATYTYDAIGRRVEKVVTAGSTTRFILDGVQSIEEYDGTGAWQARYLYEDGIDRPRAFDRADIADVNGNANTTEVLRFHYHQQALGSVTEISQPTGAVVEWVTYDVYGAAVIRDRLGATVPSSAVGNRAASHDILHNSDEFSTVGRFWPLPESGKHDARATGGTGPHAQTPPGTGPARAAPLTSPGRGSPPPIYRQRDPHAQTAHRALRFSSSRRCRAPALPTANRPGTSSPVPRYISSGVWPRNAECGSFALCSST